MILPILTGLIFVVILGLVMSGCYFFVFAPMQRQKMVTRLAALQQVSLRSAGEPEEEDIFRREMLSDIPALNRILIQLPFVARLQLFLQQAAIEMQLAAFLLIVVSSVLLSLMIALVADVTFISYAGLAFFAGAAPFLVVHYKRRKRFSRFEEQFPDAMDLLARAVRAGHAFTTAFSLIGEEMPDPVAAEFRIAHRQQSLGLPLREALANMAQRVPLPDVRIFVSAIQIQRDTGGNLGEILDNLSTVVRERFKIFREVRVLTAEGRMSMYFLLVMPSLVGVIMYFINPENMQLLFTDPMGQRAVTVGAIMQFFGYLIIRKMIRLKV